MCVGKGVVPEAPRGTSGENREKPSFRFLGLASAVVVVVVVVAALTCTQLFVLMLVRRVNDVVVQVCTG